MIHCTEKHVTLAGGRVTVDFDRDAYARLEIEVNLREPAELEIVLGEVRDPDGSVNRAPGGFRIVRVMKRFSPAGTSRFDFDIPPHRSPYWHTLSVRVPPEAGGEVTPFRYVEINGGTGSAKLVRKELYGDFDDSAADFRCSAPRLNELWDFCKYTMKAAGAFGIYIDGERERKPYEGDAFINMLGDLCCGGGRETAFATLVWLFQMPTYPTEWQLLAPRLLRDYLLYTGRMDDKTKLLRLLEPHIRELLRQSDDDFLLRDGRPAGDDRRAVQGRCDIIDWPAGERDNYEFGEVNLVPNCYWFDALNSMAELTGRQEYADRAGKVKNAILRTMYRNGRFTDNPDTEHTALHSAFFPLYFDLSDDPAPLRERLAARGMACSVYGAQFLIESCFRYGLVPEAFRLLTGDGLRSYRNMLAKGATITMETWDDSLKPNQDWTHAWGAAPANLIPRCLAGIRPTVPGFAEFTVDPKPGELAFFSLRHPTPHGPVRLDWENGEFRLVVPEKTRARYRGKLLSPGEHRFR